MRNRWDTNVRKIIAAFSGGEPSVIVYDEHRNELYSHDCWRAVRIGAYRLIPVLCGLAAQLDSGALTFDSEVDGRPLRSVVLGAVTDPGALADLAAFIGLDAINAAARAIGMEHTQLTEEEIGDTTCAADIAAFFAALLETKNVSESTATALLAILTSVPRCDKFAVQTSSGFIGFAASLFGCEYDAGIFLPAGRDPVAVAAFVTGLKDHRNGIAFCEDIARAIAGD